MKFQILAVAAALCAASYAQPAKKAAPPASTSKAAPEKPFQNQASSTISFTGKEGEQTLEITNVAYEVTNSFISGRPREERLVLRKTIHTKEVVGDIGMEASTLLEAWPLGTDLKQKPIYALKVEGKDGKTLDSGLFVVDRGLEEVEWWSVYKLGTAQHLFDTFVPVVAFSISRSELTERYAGLEVPVDDVKDARLKEPHVVAVVSYASAAKLIREALITCDDPKQAELLRSLADSNHALALVETEPANPKGEPARTLRITIKQNYPSPPGTVALQIPIAGDDLDVTHAQLPAKVHVAAWKR
jgi:hypothetical protein